MDHVVSLSTSSHSRLVFITIHHVVSAAVSRLNYLPGLMALTHCDSLAIRMDEQANINHLTYFITYKITQ